MSTEYPDDFDSFIEPTLPEETPLSSAGSGDRNHVEHHRDLGDAVEAIQHNAALKGHDHSGDADDIAKGGKLDQTNTHENVDTDTANGIHHTLGKGATQAAKGDHIHDYTSNEIINKPWEICPSTNRPPPFPGKMIYELDTNRVRVWAQFNNSHVAVQGLYSTDTFERTSSTDLGTSLWDQTYLIASGAGKMATPGGHSAAWIKQGSVANRCIARRINAADEYTESDDQVITLKTNENTADWTNPSADNPNSNDAYFRMSDDKQTYVRAALTWWKGSTGAIMLTYTESGPLGEQLLGQLPAPTDTPNITWQLRLVGNKFEAYAGVEYMGAINDNQGVTLTGYKGWGIGMQGGDGGAQQSLPNEISEVGIADATHYVSSAQWQLLPMGDFPRVGLFAGREQSIAPTGTVLEWDVVGEDNFGFYNPANKTSILIKESGLYHVHASIAWATQLKGDHAGTVIVINGVPSLHMHWDFVRGFQYTPGFSQTVDASAYIRLQQGDRLGVAAAHNGGAPQFTGYKKGDQITQMSRFFVTFHCA